MEPFKFINRFLMLIKPGQKMLKLWVTIEANE